MTVFWKQGFTAASMSDIYAATGLKPGNLYATFTDKHTLFRRAFEAYAGSSARPCRRTCRGWPPSAPGSTCRRASPSKTPSARAA